MQQSSTGVGALFIGAEAPINGTEAPCNHQQILYLLALVSRAVFEQTVGVGACTQGAAITSHFFTSAGALLNDAETHITEVDHCHY